MQSKPFSEHYAIRVCFLFGFILPQPRSFSTLPQMLSVVTGGGPAKSSMSGYIEILIPICFTRCSIVFLLVAYLFLLGHAYLINTLLLPNSFYLSPDSSFSCSAGVSLECTDLNK